VALLIANNMRRLLRDDGQLSGAKIIQFIRDFAGEQGLVTSEIVQQFFDYYRPSFHPFDHDTKVLEQHWREKLQLAAA